jgi:hypothetical protein
MTLLARSIPARDRRGRLAKMAAAAIGCGVLLAGPAAFAHHSFAAFHQDKEQTITGVVKDWQWTNPHTFMTVTAPAAKGGSADYLIEGGSPSIWRQRGYTRDVVKPGDKVTVKFHPRKDGTPGGNFIDITGPNGRSLKAGPA